MHSLAGDVESVVERRSNEVSNFLSMLRSTTLVNDVERSKSNEDSRPWKVCFLLQLFINLHHLYFNY